MLKVGSLEVEKGKKKSGYLQVGERAIGTIDLPVTLIHGSKKGPTFSMTAGFHPREYAGIDSVTRIAKMVDPSKLSGNLILVHIANVPAFIERGRENPVDLLHPTNCFPGDPNGTLSHRIAFALAKEVIDQSDYYMDHHSGDVQWAGPDNIIYPVVGKEEVDKKSEAMARCYKSEYLRLSKSRDNKSALGYAANKGVACCIVETGSMMGILSKEGILDEEVIEWNIEGITNVMKLIGMTEGKAYQSTCPPITNVVHVINEHAGLFYPLVGVDKRVKKGQLLGEIRDPFGNVKEELRALVNGVTSLMYTYMAVDQGTRLIQQYEMQ